MIQSFGNLPTGEQARLYTIGAGRVKAAISDLGATLVSLWVEGVDVVLGYDDPAGYEGPSGTFFGATVGRNANRVGKAQFIMNGNLYKLDPNDNEVNNLHSGLDLYIRDNGKWIFAGVARPTFNSTEHEFTVVKRMAEGTKECLLYLPMFTGVTSLEIGVDSGATIEPMESPFKYKIAFIGSSITHGASASRPGATYVARFGRELNAEMANIGLSGQCKLDNYFANIVCENTADAFIFDTFSNPTKEQIEERLDNFVKRVATAHPDKPLIFLQTIKRDIGYFDIGARKRNDDQLAVAEKGMARLCKEYKNVYFINPGIILGDNYEGTVDGTHLNDLGVQCTIDYLLPKLKKILKKYGIK